MTPQTKFDRKQQEEHATPDKRIGFQKTSGKVNRVSQMTYLYTMARLEKTGLKRKYFIFDSLF